MLSEADNRSRYGKVAFAAWVGIAANLAMGAAKFAGGILGASEALVADGADSLSDTLSSVVVLFGAWRARRPADERHPYGHGKAEVLAGRTVAVMVIIVGVIFGYRAVNKIVSPAEEPVPEVWTLAFAAASVAGKELLAQYKMRLGRRLRSESLVADGMNHRSDVLASLLAMGGIASAIWLGPQWRVLDLVAAVAICLIIFGIGVAAFVRTGSALMDETADPETIEAVRRVAAGVEGVKGTEKLLTRRSGLETHLDLHVEVDPAMPVGRAHEIASQVDAAIRREVFGVTRVTVHVEPYYPGDH